MAYKDLDPKDIEPMICYVSRKELLNRTGVAPQTLQNHVKKDIITAYRFHGRTYFHPDDAEEYEKLSNAGIL